MAIIQPLSQLSQSAVPWSPGSLLSSLPLPGSSSGNQQANLLFWLLLANSLQVCIHRDAKRGVGIHVFHANYFMLNRVGLGCLPCIYIGNPEYPNGKANCSCLPFWKLQK